MGSSNSYYTHDSYDTVYPEYVLVIEPILKSTIIVNQETGEVIDLIEYYDQQISTLKLNWADIKKQIKGYVNNFWKMVKNTVQKTLHPQMIESRNSLVKTLQLSLSEFQISNENSKNVTSENSKLNVSRKELEQYK